MMKKKLLSYQNVSKYYEHNCLQKFILLFVSLLQFLLLKTVIFGWNLFYLSKKKRPSRSNFRIKNVSNALEFLITPDQP